jgi:7-cyano-7-deazaguanine synthase
VSADNLVLLSGGIDSATLLADSAAQGHAQRALFVDYGQAPASRERVCSKAIADHFEVEWNTVEITGFEIPDGEIPGRNALLAHIALTKLGGGHAACIFLGIHAGTPYRDCTPEFVEETQRSLDFQSGGAARLVAPYVTWPKRLLIDHALSLGIPLDLTHSCERSIEPCEDCLSCIDRRAILARA